MITSLRLETYNQLWLYVLKVIHYYCINLKHRLEKSAGYGNLMCLSSQTKSLDLQLCTGVFTVCSFQFVNSRNHTYQKVLVGNCK